MGWLYGRLVIKDKPTIRSRQLGARLELLMKAKQLSMRQVAKQLGMSAVWVSYVMHGRSPVSKVEVARVLTVLGVVGEEYDELMDFCDDVAKPGLLEKYDSRLPTQLRTLIWHEERATAISQFHGCSIPGLLQTADYARSLITEIGNAKKLDVIDERVFARMSRQVILTQEPLIKFEFFIHEFALRLPIGRDNWTVMRGQLGDLLRLSNHSNVAIRVVLADVGAHPAMAGHFQLIESAEFNPVVYMDSEVSSLFLEEENEIKAYQRVLRGLDGVALSEAQSREFIAKLAVELYSVGAQQNVGHLA